MRGTEASGIVGAERMESVIKRPTGGLGDHANFCLSS